MGEFIWRGEVKEQRRGRFTLSLWSLYVFVSFAAADDSSDHVSTLCLGPAEQRHDCIILVWNTI